MAPEFTSCETTVAGLNLKRIIVYKNNKLM